MAQHTDSSIPPRWHALAGAALFNIAIGSYYAWSVFVAPLQKEFGWSRLATTSVASVEMVMLATMYLVAGRIINRFGPRKIAVAGGLCFSSGMLLASLIQGPEAGTAPLVELYLTAGLLLGTGLGFGYYPPLHVGFKWFPEARGLVSGIAVGVFAAGSGIVGPLAGGFRPLNWGGLISIFAGGPGSSDPYGWRHTFQLLALAYFICTMVGAYWLKDPPEHFVPPVPAARKSGATKVSHVNMTPSQMMKLPSFWVLWVAYVFGCISGTMTISQVNPFATQALGAATAAFAIPVGAAGSALGRFLSGWMSDHLGRVATVRFMLVASMIAAPALYVFRSGPAAFFILLFVVYYGYGTQLSVYTALAGDFYGPKYSAYNYGVLLLAWGTAGLLGPVIGGSVYDSFGSYQYAFYAGAVASLLSLVLLTVAKPPTEAQLAQHAAV
jgi:OFA family oxalate/formate antiporter-like MFS transporter